MLQFRVEAPQMPAASAAFEQNNVEGDYDKVPPLQSCSRSPKILSRSKIKITTNDLDQNSRRSKIVHSDLDQWQDQRSRSLILIFDLAIDLLSVKDQRSRSIIGKLEYFGAHKGPKKRLMNHFSTTYSKWQQFGKIYWSLILILLTERSKITDQDHDLIMRSVGKIKRSKITNGDLGHPKDQDHQLGWSFREIKIVIWNSSAPLGATESADQARGTSLQGNWQQERSVIWWRV